MEEEIKIPIGNKKYIYGVLRGSYAKPMVVFIHGFTGHKNEHHFYNGARFFEKKGFSSFRFDLYSWKEDGRKLEDCTFSIHGQDLDRVIDFLRSKGTKEIFVVGHSFGGLTILLSKKKDFQAAVLWDATPNPETVTQGKFLKELDLFYKTWDTSFGFTFGKEMYEENKILKPFELISTLRIPTKVIIAGVGAYVEDGKKYFNAAKKPKELTIIDNATHGFEEDGVEEKLFNETYKWIIKYRFKAKRG